MNLKKIVGFLKETISEFTEDKATRLAAALSYYTVISLSPLVVITITVAGLFYADQADLRNRLMTQVQGMVGEQGAAAVQSILDNATQPEAGGMIATVASIIILLFGASGVFSQLQDSMNTIWDVEPTPGVGIMANIKDRLLSFTMVLGVGFLLLVSLILNAILSYLGTFFEGILPGNEILWQVINFLVSFGIITLLFALIYKIVPDVEVAWKDVWVGALFTSLLFNIGKFLIGLYLGRSSAASAYGAAGSIIIILLWVYYSSIILFLGAEFTQVYARSFGEELAPRRNARYISPAAREAQGIPLRKPVRGRPAVLDQKQPEYASPLAYPATEAVHMRQGGPGDAAMIPVTGPVPPKAMKVVPVIVLGAVAAGYTIFEVFRATGNRVKLAVKRRRNTPTRLKKIAKDIQNRIKRS